MITVDPSSLYKKSRFLGDPQDFIKTSYFQSFQKIIEWL
jgi:hypothetical protein